MRDFTVEDRAQRERLERASPSAPRLDMAAMVNGMAAGRGDKELPGVASYLLLHGMQAHRRHVDRLNAKHDRLARAGKLDVGESEGEPLAKAAARPGVDRVDRRAVAARAFRARYW